MANDWFKSFLSQRKQSVRIGSLLSDAQFICYGVPQGSVLGPILFLIYINDITMGTKSGKPTLFADDTCIFYSKETISDLELSMNEDLIEISKWLVANKLSLNILKSNFVVFGPKKHVKLNISLNNVILNQQDCVKYLGIFIDSDLSWKSHITYLRTVYYSFIYSHCGIWY